MGLGPALREEMQFDDGAITNASFRRYRVPHFNDVPTIETHAMNRPDVEPVGAGETPIIVDRPGDRQRGVSGDGQADSQHADEVAGGVKP